ncbi:MAG TPA: crosslink repair DNA glycosylase YcaQ family protein, partial [Capillimicrobium sp.]
MARRDALSAAQARRIALAAQGFGRGRPGADGEPVSARAMLSTAQRLGVIQIDSVNVLSRAHYLPLFARLGPYPRERLDQAAHRAPRRLFEYWGHEASLLPVTAHPLVRWRMARARDEAWGGMRRIADEQPDLLARVLDDVRERGPASAGELAAEEAPRPKDHWGWNWSDVKRALEFLFWSGQVTSARRRGFERLYDLPERVLPREVVQAPTPSEADAQRELVAIAARALGVAAERDLRDYFRLP